MCDNEITENIKKDIQKCSRCALCLQNCPIYDVVKNENNTSRGLICKLNGFEKQELTEKEIKKDFKICLMCAKCKTNCPSKIDTLGVFSYKNAILNPSKLSQKLFLFLKLLPIKILYFLNFFKKKAKCAQSNIYYFKGCVSLAQHKTTFLDKLFYNPEFACCALPYLGGGDLKSYKNAKNKNTALIKRATKVVFDCATCFMAVSEYDTLDEADKKKLVFFTDALLDEKFLDEKLKLKKNSKYKNKTITFHKPCHMRESEFLKIEKILSNIDNITYKRLENYDSCCGFGGSYFVFHPVISSKISIKKAKTIKKSKADLILTACPSCTLGLRFSQLISFNFKKTLELRDFINSEIEPLN